jgi:hypothetical protein
MTGRESRPTMGAAPLVIAATAPSRTQPTDCCRDTAAEVVREVTAALATIKASAIELTSFAPLLDGFTYTRPEDDPDDEPRNAYDEAIVAALMLDSDVDSLLERVRRVAWLHDLDHGRTR